MVCVDGFLESVGVAQTYKETYNEEYCVSPDACDGVTVRVYRDSAR